MKKDKVLYLAAAGVGVWAVSKYLSHSLTKGVNIQLVSFSIKNISNVSVTIKIFNPTNNTINIDSISANILFNGSPIGTIQYINKTPIAPLSEVIWTGIKVNLTPDGAITVIQNIIDQKTSSGGVITAQGYVFIHGLGMPFNQVKKIY